MYGPEKFPTEVSHTHKVSAEVVINDGGALREMKADERGWVMSYVNGAIAKEFESRLPDAPRPARAD